MRTEEIIQLISVGVQGATQLLSTLKKNDKKRPPQVDMATQEELDQVKDVVIQAMEQQGKSINVFGEVATINDKEIKDLQRQMDSIEKKNQILASDLERVMRLQNKEAQKSEEN